LLDCFAGIFDVLFKLAAAEFPGEPQAMSGATGGGQAVMLPLRGFAAANETRRHFRDHLGHLALG